MEAHPHVTVLRDYGQNAQFWLPVYQQWRSNFTVLTKHAIFTVSLTLGNATLHLPCKTTYLQQHSTSQLTRNTHTHFELKKAVALVTHRSDPSPLCWCQGFLWLMLVLHFCNISCTFGPYWLNYTKGISTSFLFLESASGNYRVSVKVFLWWYLSYEGTYNTYRSFRWHWAMWIYSNAQFPCFI